MTSSTSTAAALTDITLRRYHDEVAIISESGRSTSFSELRERVYRLAGFLVDGLGLTKGDRLAVLADNRPEYIELDYAAALTGIVKVPLYMRNAPVEHVFMLTDAAVSALFIDRAVAGSLWEELGNDWPGLQGKVVAFSGAGAGAGAGAGDDVPGMRDYEQCLSSGRAVRPDISQISPADYYHIRYTSGTTGRPKGAATSQGAMLAATVGNLGFHALERPVGSADVMAHVMPMSHSAAFDLIGHSWAGVAHVPVSKWDPERFVSHVQQHRVSITMTVPTMIDMLLEYVMDRRDLDLSSLVTVAYGGAPISESSLAKAVDRLGPVLTQGYGSTETPSLIAWLPKRDHVRGDPRLRSCGTPAPFVDIKVLDGDGQECPPDEVGELCIKSPTALTEYINRPEATREALRGGWYHSGDLGVMDERGYIYLRDRKRDVIISGGFNVYPAEVENVLMSHPEVLECAVVGAPDPRWGEAVSAMVRVRDGVEIELEALQAHCRKSLGRYKQPRHLIVTREPLPTSPVGKILRREVRKFFEPEETA